MRFTLIAFKARCDKRSGFRGDRQARKLRQERHVYSNASSSHSCTVDDMKNWQPVLHVINRVGKARGGPVTINMPLLTELSPDRGLTVSRRSQAAFTLAEVLAALVFMAIVIPVAVQGLRIANLAGQVAVHKSEATRVAERVLNESIVTTNWNKSGLSGTAIEGTHQFSWVMRNEAWNQDPIRLLSVQVAFAVQGQQYDVRLSTLIDNSPPQ